MYLAIFGVLLVILILILVLRNTQPLCSQDRNETRAMIKMPANTVATFERDDLDEFRPIAESGPMVENISLPKNFMASSKWPLSISGVFDQERCGSCWAFATSNAFSDRLKIKYQGKILSENDYISPFNLAACVKCGVNGACPRVCEGNYLDDVCQFLVDEGAMPQSIIEKHGNKSLSYHCFDYLTVGVKPVKAKRKYRVNLFPPSMLKDANHLASNEKAIMTDVYKHGTVCCIIKVYVPPDSRNFYLYDKGIYGHGWKSMPTQMEGYHAITILGWGEEKIGNKIVKYWIVRNSWGNSWGTQGLGRILRGQNFGMIESDVWALEV